MKSKVCFVSTSRADYSLLLPTIKHSLSLKNKNINTDVIVTGSHLIKSHGMTSLQFKKDGVPIAFDFKIKDKTDIKGIKDNFKQSIEGFYSAYSKLKPNFVVLLGDRYEVFCAAVCAHMMGIKIAHLHGGELTYGAYDDAYRHAITKFSYLHFTASEKYRNRVIQMGENPKKVFNVGPLAKEMIESVKLMSLKELEEDLDVKIKGKLILATFHPEIGTEKHNKENLTNLIDALGSFQDETIIFSSPNLDLSGNEVRKLLKSKIKKMPNFYYRESLGPELYYNLMRRASCMIGNSSSGIIEAPLLNVNSINVGNRQDGRDQSDSTINCSFNSSELIKIITKTLSKTKKKKNLKYKSMASRAIMSEILKSVEDKNNKQFYDLKDVN